MHVLNNMHHFVHQLDRQFSRLNSFTLVMLGTLISDCVVWALLIVEGRTATIWYFVQSCLVDNLATSFFFNINISYVF